MLVDPRRRFRFLLLLFALAVLPAECWGQHPIRFSTHLLTVDANEGCAIADLDGDGKLDVIAGRNWYHNDDWVPRPLRQIEDRNGYTRSNGEWAWDVDDDGDPDVVSVDFFDGHVYWYENLGAESIMQGLLWPRHLLVDTGLTNNEASFLIDLDADGTPEWISDQWVATKPLIAWSFQKIAAADNASVKKISLSPHHIGDSTGHGIGFGDINNDGRRDILVGTGWYECPKGDLWGKPWRFHRAWDLHAPCPMIVVDIDGDQITDLITSEAHGFGLYWWKGKGVDEKGEPQFEKRLIDDSFSQAHCLHWDDIDGDNQPELITGKRVRAHNGRDPGGTDPPVMKYYVWNSANEAFDAHIINRGEVGTGLQIRTADLDQDGDTDIVVAGKEGTQILFNLRFD